ncbi:hypothetical protein [Spiroplasma endosymbiont of Zeiraphera isertana]
MTNNELMDVLKNKKDEEFIKIIRHFKNRIKQIEKKEKLVMFSNLCNLQK